MGRGSSVRSFPQRQRIRRFRIVQIRQSCQLQCWVNPWSYHHHHSWDSIIWYRTTIRSRARLHSSSWDIRDIFSWRYVQGSTGNWTCWASSQANWSDSIRWTRKSKSGWSKTKKREKKLKPSVIMLCSNTQTGSGKPYTGARQRWRHMLISTVRHFQRTATQSKANTEKRKRCHMRII